MKRKPSEKNLEEFIPAIMGFLVTSPGRDYGNVLNTARKIIQCCWIAGMSMEDYTYLFKKMTSEPQETLEWLSERLERIIFDEKERERQYRNALRISYRIIQDCWRRGVSEGYCRCFLERIWGLHLPPEVSAALERTYHPYTCFDKYITDLKDFLRSTTPED
ncbi:hypothetical protein DRJ19_03135 [Candidatus Woesearchaeota archaeon]|nr:MAG: hypothetical protein DRJ19_03135 [Candidatus Woesearchaeota archaeon]